MKKFMITIYRDVNNQWHWCLYDSFMPFSITSLMTCFEADEMVKQRNQKPTAN